MKVAVGQCFVKADVPYPDVWQVAGIHQPPGFLTHVRLVRVENPGDSKTVSLVTLGDRRHYRPHDANRVVRRRLINSPRANPLQEARASVCRAQPSRAGRFMASAVRAASRP